MAFPSNVNPTSHVNMTSVMLPSVDKTKSPFTGWVIEVHEAETQNRCNGNKDHRTTQHILLSF